MATKDYLKPGKVTQGGVTISEPPSGGTSFLSTFLGGLTEKMKPDTQLAREKSKLSYYTELRQQGYSSEEATARTQKQFSGDFFANLASRDAAGFKPPSGTEPQTLATQKSQAELAKTKAETGYYNRRTGRPAGTGGTGDTQRIKSLTTMIEDKQDALDEAKKNKLPTEKIQSSIDKYQKILDKLLGDVSGSDAPQEGYVEGETKPGEPFIGEDGNTYIVDPDDPGDPSDPNILPA